MSYNGWKMMDKVDVAIKTSPDNSYYGRTFDAYVAEHGDKKALESAKDWARSREYDHEKREYTVTYEPKVHTFDNEGFTVKILKSAGGSSQGGRLSFLACEIEKDGVKFVIGVNDGLLVDLIRNSEISKGVIKEKVMFVRKGGQPGFIHEGMEAYKEAIADMEHKATIKKAKKTSKWEVGGVYSTITQTDVCLGYAWDTMEEVEDTDDRSWYRRNTKKLVKREKPVLVSVWQSFSTYTHKNGMPKTLEEFLKEELEDRNYIYVEAGKPPARAKSDQLEVKETDNLLFDELLTLKIDYSQTYGGEKIKNRYVRELK